MKRIPLDKICAVFGATCLFVSWLILQTVGESEMRIQRNFLNMHLYKYQVMESYLRNLRNLVSNRWAFDIEEHDSTYYNDNFQTEAEFLTEMHYSYLRMRANASDILIGSLTSDSALAATYSIALSNLLTLIDDEGDPEQLRAELHDYEGNLLQHYTERMNWYQSRRESSEDWQTGFYFAGSFLLILAVVVKKSV